MSKSDVETAGRKAAPDPEADHRQHERYLEFMNKFLRGEPPSETEYLEHFDHQNGMPFDMIAVGTRAPELDLVDQEGRVRSLGDLCGPRGLMLVFVRSTYWCPYCRNQLAELNLRLVSTRDSGFEIAVVTSDEPRRIREFTDHHQLGYPILTDPDGVAIDAYGIRNADIPPNELQGTRPLPHPGLFVISPDGIVAAREFTGDIRHRVSVSTVVNDLDGRDGDAPSHAVNITTPELTAAGWLSATEVLGGQEIGFTLRLRPAEGVHIYGHDVDAPYVPLSVTVESKDRLVDDVGVTYPAGTPIELPALGETLSVHESEATVQGRIRLRWSPPRSPFEELADFVASHAIPPGDYGITVALRYQACSSNECLMPTTAELDLPITIAPNAAAGSPVRLGATEIPAPEPR